MFSLLWRLRCLQSVLWRMKEQTVSLVQVTYNKCKYLLLLSLPRLYDLLNCLPYSLTAEIRQTFYWYQSDALLFSAVEESNQSIRFFNRAETWRFKNTNSQFIKIFVIWKFINANALFTSYPHQTHFLYLLQTRISTNCELYKLGCIRVQTARCPQRQFFLF